MNHTFHSSKAMSVAQSTPRDGTQATELLMLSPSQSSENTISSPSSSSRGSVSGMGMTTLLGVSAPKRSMDHVSTLCAELKAMSRTTLGSATSSASGNACCSTPRLK